MIIFKLLGDTFAVACAMQNDIDILDKKTDRQLAGPTNAVSGETPKTFLSQWVINDDF